MTFLIAGFARSLGWSSSQRLASMPIAQPHPSGILSCLRGWASSADSNMDGHDESLITDSEVEDVARLACLRLQNAGGLQVVKQDLSQMLRFVSVMDAVDVAGVEPMWSPLESDQEAPFRDDVALQPEVSGTELLSLAERTAKSYYLSPKNAGMK